MRETLEVSEGTWWRFDRYEVRDGLIRPALKARLEQYDPWQDYRKARLGRKERRAPYQLLLDVLERLAFVPGTGDRRFALTKDSEALLLKWCSAHGLLGVLPHRTQMVVLSPRWEPRVLRIRSDRKELVPTLRRYFRTSTGWSRVHEQRSSRRRIDPGQQKDLVAEEQLPKLWPPPSALLQNMQTGQWDQEPLSKSWWRFFPDVLEGEKETFGYPLPLSDEFWRLYAEPIDDFVAAALILREALWLLRRTKSHQQEAESQEDAFRAGVSRLNLLSAPVRLGLKVEDDGSLRQVWTAPSLWASFAMMALQDLSGRRRVLMCRACGRLFVSGAHQALYCSDRCRYRFEKQVQRHPDMRDEGVQQLTDEGGEDQT